MKTFVAGATGVMGRRAVAALVAAGHEVTALSRRPESDELVTAIGAVPVNVDLFDAGDVKAAVAGHDAVVNLATSIPPVDQAFKKKAWATNDRIRTEGATNLVDAAIAAGVERFVQESITYPYKDSGSDWIDESAPFDPAPVNETSLVAEAQVARFTEQGGIGVALRFGALYAPDASQTRSAVASAAKGRAPVIGALSAYVSAIHAEDAGGAVVAALGASAGTYNVVDDVPLTRGELMQVMAEAAGRRSLRRVPRWLAVALGGNTARVLMRSQRVSNQAFRAETGWAPVYPSQRSAWVDVVAASEG